MPEISVIICAYNAGRYVPRCIGSMLAQTFGDFEIIIVDDCSTDGTLAVCRQYAALDKRITVLHNSRNLGVSMSRQRAMEAATGRYTIHADADDYADPDMLQCLHRKAVETGADMVICDYYEECDGETSYKSQRPTSLAPRQVMTDLLSGRLHGSCWNKLIARKLYTDNGIRFPEGINCLEDLFVCLQLLKCNPAVTYLPKAFYHYVRIENNSITTTASTLGDMEQDRRLYDMTVALFARDAELQAAARTGIANIMVLRAFHSRRLSSARFRKEFYRFRNDVKARRHKFPFNMFFYLSCVGLYRIMLPLHDTYMWLWKIKHRRKR